MAAKDLTGVSILNFDLYASRTGSNLKFGLHDTGGMTTEITPNVTAANTWQTIAWDISAVADADKNAIDIFIVTIVNADAENTFYLDNFATEMVTVDTAKSKFGGSSASFPSTASLSVADSADMAFGTGSFTIDTWVNFSSLTNAAVICGQYEDSSNYWYVQKDTNANGNKLSMKFADGGATKGEYTMTSAWSVVADTWYHVEFSRNSTVGLIFINGVSQTITENTAFSTNNVGDMAATLVIGSQNGTKYLYGYMDEFRISKGVCRHTADFTVPTIQYGGPNYAILYNYYTNSFWPYDNMSFLSSCTADDGAGQRRVYTLTSNYAYLMDSGNDDDGTAINGYWTSPRLDHGSEVLLKRHGRLVITTDSLAVTPYVYYRVDWSTVWGAAETLTTLTNTHTIDLPISSNMLQWKIADNSVNPAFEVFRATIMAEAEGVDK